MRGRIRSLILVTGMLSPYVVTYLGEFEEDDASFFEKSGAFHTSADSVGYREKR